MRIVVVGAGPAGLTFALALKLRQPHADVTVKDRRQVQETYGWGITLPPWTIPKLQAVDPEVARRLEHACVRWRSLAVHHQGVRVEAASPPLMGIARATLLNILHERCRSLQIDVQFGQGIAAESLPDCDLLVLADGARSTIRDRFATAFGTTRQETVQQFTWLATPCRFACLTLALQPSDSGIWIGHAYPFSEQLSTFIIERPVGLHLAQRSDADTCAHLADVFADVLQGQPLQYRRTVRWAPFLKVRNERWHHERMVLLGDAAHAIHFFVGSGTSLAIEDAIALAEALDVECDLNDALSAFEQRQQSIVASMQTLEQTMLGRLTRAAADSTRAPLLLASDLLRAATDAT